MSADRGFRLGTVLRVRRVQESQALALLARARHEASAAAGALTRSEDRLDAYALPSAGTTENLVQALFSRRTLAADAAAARVTVAGADDHVRHQLTAWTAAAARVRGLERLAERHAALQAEEDLRVEQRTLDDLVRRAAGPGGAGRGRP